MKKLILIMLALTLGWLVLSGCTSTTPNQQTKTSEPTQNQEEVNTGELPQPPALPETEPDQQIESVDSSQNQQPAEVDKFPQPPALPEE